MNVVKCKNEHFFDGDTYKICPYCGEKPYCGEEVALASTPVQEEEKKKKIAMNVVKCKNGHFFDGDTYKICPYCGEKPYCGEVASAPVQEEKKKKFPWGKRKSKSAGTVSSSSTANKAENTTSEEVPCSGIENEEISSASQAPKREIDSNKTRDIWQPAHNDDDNAVAAQEIIEKDSVENTESSETEKKAETGSESQALSLQDVVKKASANSAGKTMSYFSAANAANDTQNAQTVSSDPVVGWLVCIAGNHFGESFNIGAGKNAIGRNDSNRIVLSKDNAVSREKHALVVYEPKKRNFYLQPGDSSGLTYLNGEYIDESKRLASHDVLELGESKFVFIPLCGESFSWEDYLRKE